jgi:hypothetical protein
MTRLNDKEKQAIREAANHSTPVNGSPSWMVEPNPANIERYLRALSQFPPITRSSKPVKFGGAYWKL